MHQQVVATFQDREINSLLTEDPLDAYVHVTTMSTISLTVTHVDIDDL